MASKKTRKCDTCGAIVLDDDIIERNGKYQCMDCAYPLKCYKCESQIKHADRIPLLDGHFCENCLFPDELNIKYSDFLKDYEAYKATAKKAIRKATLFRILGYLIGAVIYAVIMQFREDPLYLSYSTQDIASQSTLSGIGTILLIIAIFIPIHLILKKFFPKPELLSETDYYVENYRDKYKIDLKKHKDYKNTVQNPDDKSVISENETSVQETEDINELEDSAVELIDSEKNISSDDNNSVEERIKKQKEILKSLKKEKTNNSEKSSKIAIALLILFFPAGIIYMWVKAPWKKATKITVTSLIAVLLIIISVICILQFAEMNDNPTKYESAYVKGFTDGVDDSLYRIDSDYNNSFYDDESKSGYKDGYNDATTFKDPYNGDESRYKYDYLLGYQEGNGIGYRKGSNSGYQQGHNYGYDDGYNDGYYDAANGYSYDEYRYN